MALVDLPGVLRGRGWLDAAQAADPDLVHDTLNGLVAFVVPGPDAYSAHQGASTTEPGGIDARITDVLIETLDRSLPFAPSFSATVAGILNAVAQVVNASAGGPFPSPFARLRFPEKVAVFAALDGDPALRPLAGSLPGLVATLVYSEAGVFDSRTRVLTGRPVGWAISGYEGVADGRDEFKGYFQDRRRVEGDRKEREDDDA